MQMSLTGEMPITKDNLLRVIKAHEPVDVVELLVLMGYDRADSDAFVKAMEDASAILKPACKRGEACFMVYLDRVERDGRTVGVFHHKFSVHKLAESQGPVRGYEMVGREDDDDDDD